MRKILFCCFISALACNALYSQTAFQAAAKVTDDFSIAPSSTTSKFTALNGVIKNKKVILNWTAADNETATLFEIEKSKDGKNFTMIALVFGTGDAADNTYSFYEKKDKEKMIYRIKRVQANKECAYSGPIEPVSIP